MSTAAPRIPAYTSLVLSGVRGAADQEQHGVTGDMIDVENKRSREVLDTPARLLTTSFRYGKEGLSLSIREVPACGEATAPIVPSFGDPRLPERFWDKVHPEPITGCWLWSGALTLDGYGKYNVRQGTRRVAHRVCYELMVGPVPRSLQIDHLCRTRACVNPDHLEPVTPQVNTLRGEGPAAVHSKKTQCPEGHAYDARNTLVVRSRGGSKIRQCRICNRVRNQLRRAGAPSREALWYRHQLAIAALNHGRIDRDELLAILKGAQIADLLPSEQVS